jgi:hypothetical protein
VHFVHARSALVVGERGRALAAAAQEVAKVLVDVREEVAISEKTN